MRSLCRLRHKILSPGSICRNAVPVLERDYGQLWLFLWEARDFRHVRLHAEARMLTGWQKAGDFWYYLNTDVSGSVAPFGAMMTGWIRTAPGNPWYYLNQGMVSGYPERAMLHNTVTPDRSQVNANGEWFE